jgi:hypothetical protein
MASRNFTVNIRINADDEATATVKKVEGRFKRMGQEIRAASLKIAAGIAGVTLAFRGLEAAGDRLAQRKALETSLAAQGVAIDEYLNKLDGLARGTVTTADLVSSSSRALLLGIPADKIAGLLEVARASAIATGQDISTAFNDITTGIGRASPLILDNLGLVVDLEEVYRVAADSVDKNVASLSNEEKTLALVNDVLKVGEERVRAFGNAQDNTAQSLKQTTTRLVEAKDAILEYSLGALGTFIDRSSEAILAATGVADATDATRISLFALEEGAFRAGVSVAEYRAQIELAKRATRENVDVAKLSTAALSANEKEVRRLGNAYGFAAESVDILDKAERRRLRIEEDIKAASEGFADAVEALGITLSTEVNEAIEENNQLLEQAEKLYRLGELSAADYQRVQEGIANSNRDATASLNEQAASFDVVSDATDGAIRKQIEYAEATGHTTTALRVQNEQLRANAGAANAIPGVSGGQSGSGFATVGGGNFVTITRLPGTTSDGRVVVPGVGRAIAHPSFVRVIA